jgi:thymidylate synthase (FAD)
MEKYWCDPTEYHRKRVTAHFICSRATSHELVRHASLRPMQESTRYCNYSTSKFGSEITYILPQWIYNVRDEIGNTVDPLTNESRKWILELDGQDLWNTLTCYDRTVASRDNRLREAESEYLWEITTEESYRLRPEDARGGLPHDLKTELYMCGYIEDWCMRPKTKERTGFFFLRSDQSAHPDVRVLSQALEEIFKEKGYETD